MRGQLDVQIQIAIRVGGCSGMTLATQTHLGSVGHSLGNLDADRALTAHQIAVLIKGRHLQGELPLATAIRFFQGDGECRVNVFAPVIERVASAAGMSIARLSARPAPTKQRLEEIAEIFTFA